MSSTLIIGLLYLAESAKKMRKIRLNEGEREKQHTVHRKLPNKNSTWEVVAQLVMCFYFVVS